MKRTNYLSTFSAAALLSVVGLTSVAMAGDNLAESRYETVRNQSNALVEEIKTQISYHQEYNADYTGAVTTLADRLGKLAAENAKSIDRSKPEYRAQVTNIMSILSSLKSSIATPNPEFDGPSIVGQLEALKAHEPKLPQQVRAEIDQAIAVMKSRPSIDSKGRPLPTPSTELKKPEWFDSMNKRKDANAALAKQAEATLYASKDACSLDELKARIEALTAEKKAADEELRIANRTRLKKTLMEAGSLAKESFFLKGKTMADEKKVEELEKTVNQELNRLSDLEAKISANKRNVEAQVAEMVSIDITGLKAKPDHQLKEEGIGKYMAKGVNWLGQKALDLENKKTKNSLVSTTLNAIFDSVLKSTDPLTGKGNDLTQVFTNVKAVEATAQALNVKLKVVPKDPSKVEEQLQKLSDLRTESNILQSEIVDARASVDARMLELGVPRERLATAAANAVALTYAASRDSRADVRLGSQNRTNQINLEFDVVAVDVNIRLTELNARLAELATHSRCRATADTLGVLGTLPVPGALGFGAHTESGLKTLEQQYKSLPQRPVGPPRP